EEGLPVGLVAHAPTSSRGADRHDRHHEEMHDDHADAGRMREEPGPASPGEHHEEEKAENVEGNSEGLLEADPWRLRRGFVHTTSLPIPPRPAGSVAAF